MFHPQQKPGPLWPLNPEHHLARNLVGCWVFNEGTGSLVKDYSLYRNHATTHASPSWIGLRPEFFKGYGPVLTLDGASQYADAPFKSVYNNTLNALTLEVVYRITSNSSLNHGIFGRGDLGASSGTWGIVYVGGASQHSVFQLGGTQSFGRLAINATQFHHVVGAWDGTNMRVYERSFLTRTTAKSSFTPSGTDNLFFGNDSSSNFLSGDVALARLWMNRAISETEAIELFQQPWGMFMPSIQNRYWLLDVSRPTKTIQARANIKGTQTRTIQARAKIRNTSDQSIQARARITHQSLHPIQAQAAIETAETHLDTVLAEWSVSDEFDTFSRQFSAKTTDPDCLAPGNQIILSAGYDTRRLQLINGLIDRVTKTATPDNKSYVATGRDAGARELQTFRITKVWKSQPTTDVLNKSDMPTAHQIIRDVAGFAGLTVGNLDFPNYRLYNSYIALGKRVLEIVSELAEPWNQFARVQYIPQVRDRTLSVIKVDWENVPSGGYVVLKDQHSQQQIQQELYLDEPRLNEVQKIIIRGAAYLKDLCALGPQIRTEYLRNVVTAEVGQAIAGQVTAPGDDLQTQANPSTSKEVTTEVSTVETVYCDKVINRVETTYIDDQLSERTTERFWYYEPGVHVGNIPADAETFTVQSLTPSDNALLYMAHTKREGWKDRGGVVQFFEIQRQLTEYQYDGEKNVACELTTTQEFDEDLGIFGITKHASRTHSQLSGGSVRTTLRSFIFEDSKYKLSTADVQHVGGTRPSINQGGSKKNVQTIQAQSPQGELDGNGDPIDPGEGFYTWTYENNYIGQDVCDTLYAQAISEQNFQLSGAFWEILNFQGVLNPNIHVGRPVSLERDDGTFADYIVESLSHDYGAEFAGSSGVAKRITTEELP